MARRLTSNTVAQPEERAFRVRRRRGARWAAVASLVETCKLNGVDPQRYFADLLTRLVNGWPNSRIDELMPWRWAKPGNA